jgi:hypothetical protein
MSWTWDTNHWDHADGDTKSISTDLPCTGSKVYKIEISYTTSVEGGGFSPYANSVDLTDGSPLTDSGTVIYYVKESPGS